MNFQTTLTEDRRLSLLLVLEQTPGYSANAFLLRDAVSQIYGHSCSIDQVRTDVAAGRAMQPGVKKPMP